MIEVEVTHKLALRANCLLCRLFARYREENQMPHSASLGFLYAYIIPQFIRNVKKIMNYIYGEFHLKRVCVILSHGRFLQPLLPPVGLLEEAGIVCEAMLAQEEYPVGAGTLYITDDATALKSLVEQGLPVAVYLHEGNRGLDMSAARYAFEEPEQLNSVYFERVYRRYADLPWDILETGRCFLRETQVSDVDDFYEIYKAPGMTQYTEALYESKVSERAYVREYIEKVYKYFEFGVWTVVLKETGQVIGRAGLNVREGYDLPELGYVIGRPWQGKGIATEVCKAILEYARSEYGFERVMTIIQKENGSSLKLAKGLGFRVQEEIWQNNKDYLVLIVENS